jgi:hypothetical protein
MPERLRLNGNKHCPGTNWNQEQQKQNDRNQQRVCHRTDRAKRRCRRHFKLSAERAVGVLAHVATLQDQRQTHQDNQYLRVPAGTLRLAAGTSHNIVTLDAEKQWKKRDRSPKNGF